MRRPFYGWAVVAVGVVVMFCSAPGQAYLFSVFLDSIIADTGLSRTTISALFSVGVGVSGLLLIAIGRLADRHGPRRLLIASALALGLACFGMAAANGAVAILLAFAALRTLGQAALPLLAALLTAHWFVRRRGLAMAIVAMGFAVSNAVFPTLARLSIDRIGWRESYGALGLMVWLVVLPGAIWVVRNSPEEMGLHPDGAPHAPPQEAVPARAGASGAAGTVFGAPLFWLLALAMAIFPFAAMSVVFHQTSIFAERGLSATAAAGAFVPYSVGLAIASLAAGLIVDRVGLLRMFVADMALVVGGLLIVRFFGSTGAATAYALLLGAALGIFLLLQNVIWAHFYGRRGLGRVQGAAVMIGITASALGPLALALLHREGGNYDLGLTVMAALPLLAVALMALAERTGPAPAQIPFARAEE